MSKKRKTRVAGEEVVKVAALVAKGIKDLSQVLKPTLLRLHQRLAKIDPEKRPKFELIYSF